MIYDIDNTLLLAPVLEMAKKVEDIPPDQVKQMLIDGIASKHAKLQVEKNREYGQVMGFIFATLEKMNGEDCVFIQITYVEPGPTNKYVFFELLLKIMLWAKDMKVNWVYAISQRPKVFIKKYKFQEAGTLLKRGVNNGISI